MHHPLETTPLRSLEEVAEFFARSFAEEPPLRMGRPTPVA